MEKMNKVYVREYSCVKFTIKRYYDILNSMSLEISEHQYLYFSSWLNDFESLPIRSLLLEPAESQSDGGV